VQAHLAGLGGLDEITVPIAGGVDDDDLVDAHRSQRTCTVDSVHGVNLVVDLKGKTGENG